MRNVPPSTLPFLALCGAAISISSCERSPATVPEADLEIVAPRAARTAGPPAAVCGEADYPLLAGNGGGNGFVVGRVTIGNDESQLYVSLYAAAGWSMTASHVAVAHDPELIPRNDNNVVPGHFPDGGDHDPPLAEVHYAVSLEVLDGATDAVVAAHADMVDGDGVSEGAWIEGPEIAPGRRRASYAAYALAACGGVSEEIGPDGGVLTLGGATLTLSAGSVEEPTTITMEQVDESQLPPGALPGTAFDLRPDGTPFLNEVTLSIPFNPAHIPAGLDENDLAIWFLDEASGEWNSMPSTVVNGSVVTTLEHLSTYAVVPGVFSVELAGFPPDPIPENQQLEMEIRIRNESTTEGLAEQALVFTVEGDLGSWGYPTTICDLVSSGTTHTFTCDPLAGLPPRSERRLIIHATPASGSAASSISAWAVVTVAPYVRRVDAPTLPIVAPLPEVDLDLNVSYEPYPDLRVLNTAVFEVVVANPGLDPVESATLTVEMIGEETLDVSHDLPGYCTVDPPSEPGYTSFECVLLGIPSGGSITTTFDFFPRVVGSLEMTIRISDLVGVIDPIPLNNEWHQILNVLPEP